MAGGPSPSSTSPSNLSNNSPFLHGSFSSTSSSPPKNPYAAHNTMTADAFTGSHSYALPAPIGSRALDKSSMGLLSFSEVEFSPDSKGPPAIFLRKLPSSSDREAVRNILLFSQDMIDCELVPSSKFPEDKGFASAVARFRSIEGAKEARRMLDGKRNASNDANIIVELIQDGLPSAIGSRRNTVDGTSTRQGSVSAASGISANGQTGRQSSRYNGTFQHMEKMSPPNGTPGLGNGEFPVQNLFSPTSPVSTSFNHRNLGKSVINDEADDESDGLLNETIGFATGSQQSQVSMPRRPTNPSIPVSRFSALSLNTNGTNGMSSPPLTNYSSPRSGAPVQSPSTNTTLSAMSPHSTPSSLNNIGPNANYQQFSQHFPPRHNYPPVNPADQNPPCNTLYVGNLPIDTSEDELKAMFSKQRGYKRLCFRTKQNGPMCFVEFEDISFATKALNELYGHPLHNSVKGGIRLSFSKNPLGVRTGQPSSMGCATPLQQSSVMSGFGGSGGSLTPGFTTATGPPPGLSVPPGLQASSSGHSNSTSNFGMFSNGGFGVSHNDMSSPIRTHTQPMGGMATSVGGSAFGGMGGRFPTYMMGN